MTASANYGCPPVLALFQKRLEGDDALLQLAKLRFEQAGLGAEFYAENIAELGHLLGFRPKVAAPSVVHLPRWIDLFNDSHRRLIGEFGRAFTGRIFALVVHDQVEAARRDDAYVSRLREIGEELRAAGGPILFIEYACGLSPEVFTQLFDEVRGLTHISCCIDTGHLAIRLARDSFAVTHPGLDVCSLRPDDPALRSLIDDVQAAVLSVPETAVLFIERLFRIGKPVHLHLHDGHPLSVASPFGVSDHLDFLSTVPLPFGYLGKRSLQPIFGPQGMKKVIALASGLLGPEHCTISLEIHPTGGRRSLGDASHLFSHWTDKTHAEQMNHWLWLLAENHELVLRSCAEGA